MKTGISFCSNDFLPFLVQVEVMVKKKNISSKKDITLKPLTTYFSLAFIFS